MSPKAYANLFDVQYSVLKFTLLLKIVIYPSMYTITLKLKGIEDALEFCLLTFKINGCNGSPFLGSWQEAFRCTDDRFNDRSEHKASPNNRVTTEAAIKVDGKGENVMTIVE